MDKKNEEKVMKQEAQILKMELEDLKSSDSDEDKPIPRSPSPESDSDSGKILDLLPQIIQGENDEVAILMPVLSEAVDDTKLRCLAYIATELDVLGEHRLTIARTVASKFGELPLYEMMINWCEKLRNQGAIEGDDEEVMSTLESRNPILMYVVLLCTLHTFSPALAATLSEKFLPKGRIERFGVKWEDCSPGLQLLVVKVSIGNLGSLHLRTIIAKVIGGIAFHSDPIGAWQDLEADLREMLNEEDNLKVTGALKAVQSISETCHVNGLVGLQSIINEFFPRVVGLLGNNTASGATIKEMVLCRTSYVLNPLTRDILIGKLQDHTAEPNILEALKQFKAEAKDEGNSKRRRI
ncbi:Armadillo-like helical [Corchorus olitorius]|uniref:Armadillo-like helical n=1 Tax=Corchorus olitorius TaxID=93759 RepID=A0A1R3KB85_9ROSI|nr:Armadillo-like helical [Corchorus olitorius]